MKNFSSVIDNAMQLDIQDVSTDINTLDSDNFVVGYLAFNLPSISFLEVQTVGPGFLPTNVVYGTNGDDTLRGKNEFAYDPEKGLVINLDDFIHGFDGDDNISGQGGNDFLYGGRGNDIIFGGSGNDLLSGGVDDFGQSGLDQLVGGQGSDDFMIGDNGFSHYLDGGNYVQIEGNINITGLSDFVVIWDFSEEDSLIAPGVNTNDSGKYEGGPVSYENLASVGLEYLSLGSDTIRDTWITYQYSGSNFFDVVGILVDVDISLPTIHYPGLFHSHESHNMLGFQAISSL
jgi:hypothetical protein